MENILKRLLKYQKIHILSTESWHKDLLDLSLEHQIISGNTSQNLDRYRAFRHFFIHGYGVMLEKEKILPLAHNLQNVWNGFMNDIESYLNLQDIK